MEILEKTELKYIRRRYGSPDEWRRCLGDSKGTCENILYKSGYEVYQFIDFFGKKKSCYMVVYKKMKELTNKIYYMKKDENR